MTVINPAAGTEMTILPATSPFGFDYADAVISLTDYLPAADSKNPWGNLLPLMLMSKNNGGLAVLMAMGGDITEIDPLMLLAANGDNSFLMFQLMMHNKKKCKKTDYAEAFKRAKTNIKDDIHE